jgi:hypothetical protein
MQVTPSWDLAVAPWGFVLTGIFCVVPLMIVAQPEHRKYKAKIKTRPKTLFLCITPPLNIEFLFIPIQEPSCETWLLQYPSEDPENKILNREGMCQWEN